MVESELTEEELYDLQVSYEASLEDLKENSRTKIASLTMISEENIAAADRIVAVIFRRIEQAPPEYKLPAMYLLDSIAKNVGGVYIPLFSRMLAPVFTRAYNEVNESIKGRVRHLFATWQEQRVFPADLLQLLSSRLGLPPLQAAPSEQGLPDTGGQGGRLGMGGAMAAPSGGIHVNPKFLESQRKEVSEKRTEELEGTGRQRALVAVAWGGGGGTRPGQPMPEGRPASAFGARDMGHEMAVMEGAGARGGLPLQGLRGQGPTPYAGGDGGYPNGRVPSARSNVGPMGFRGMEPAMEGGLGPTRGGLEWELANRGGGGGMVGGRMRGMEGEAGGPMAGRGGVASSREGGEFSRGVGGAGAQWGRAQGYDGPPSAHPGAFYPQEAGGASGVGLDRMTGQGGARDMAEGGAGYLGQGTGMGGISGRDGRAAGAWMAGGSGGGVAGGWGGMQGGGQNGPLGAPLVGAGSVIPADRSSVAPPAPLQQLQRILEAGQANPRSAQQLRSMMAACGDDMQRVAAAIAAAVAARESSSASGVGGGQGPTALAMRQQVPPVLLDAALAFLDAAMGAAGMAVPLMGGQQAAMVGQPGVAMASQGMGGGFGAEGVAGGVAVAEGGAGGAEDAPGTVALGAGRRTEDAGLFAQLLQEGFQSSLLKRRLEPAISALYFDLQFQCATCGLRFQTQDGHSKHLDWHFLRKRRQKAQKAASRTWFVEPKEWLAGTASDATETAPSFFDLQAKQSADVAGTEEKTAEQCCVPADDTQETCILCEEKFDVFWDPVEEEWMYRGAVYMDEEEGTGGGGDKEKVIVHAKCKGGEAPPGDVPAAKAPPPLLGKVEEPATTPPLYTGDGPAAAAADETKLAPATNVAAPGAALAELPVTDASGVALPRKRSRYR
eukprot:jgi/Mesvir1/17620/Mv08846-RA.1